MRNILAFEQDFNVTHFFTQMILSDTFYSHLQLPASQILSIFD